MSEINPNNIVYYALFNAPPDTQPPFTITLGIGTGKFDLENCKDIPDGIERIEKHCANLLLSPDFTLLYPIYMEAMDTDYEMTMHNIAWLIKEPADAKGWNFNRIGGLTGTTEYDFQPSDR